jgi:hypothetical protein
MHNRLDAREINDLGDTTLSFSEVKALATGNPLLMDKAEADATLTKLQRAERAHHRDQDTLRHPITHLQQEIARLTQLTADIDTAIAQRQDTRGDKFTMTIDGQRHLKRADAGQHLKTLLAKEIDNLAGLRARTTEPGHLGGFPLTATTERALGNTHITLELDGAPDTTIRLDTTTLRDADPGGLITRLENRLHRLEENKTTSLDRANRARRELTHAHATTGQPFPQADQLVQARDHARQIDEQLHQMAQPQHVPEHAEPELELEAGQ